MAYRTVTDVVHAGGRFTVDGDDEVLFAAKVAKGRDFEFVPPGEGAPVAITFRGLRTKTRREVIPD
jgi:hypothetical protein